MDNVPIGLGFLAAPPGYPAIISGLPALKMFLRRTWLKPAAEGQNRRDSGMKWANRGAKAVGSGQCRLCGLCYNADVGREIGRKKIERLSLL